MKNIKNTLLILATLLSLGTIAKNPEPIMYGTLTLENGETITGSLRWGDQETFLSDIFNGEKNDTVGIEYLTEDQKEDLLDHQPGPQANIGDLQITFKSFFGKDIEPPFFNTNFGALKRIDFDGKSVTATLHDGTLIATGDNHNDTGDDIYVKDSEGEVTEVDHDDIKSIQFFAAPEGARTFGDGIYGTVESSIGTFKGRIMWDKDERLTDEKLDGNDDEQEHEIKFADIKSIEKTADADVSEVILKDGVELMLTGTNDVNRGNRGIWVDTPEYGRIEIDWYQFNKLTIEAVDVNWLTFQDYVELSKPISGSVILADGSKVTAQRIIFDMNQQSNAELLYADIGGNNRQVPLFKVKSMTKKSNQSLELLLRSGIKVIAMNNRSVTFQNNGLIVSNNNRHQWYPWEKVQSIEFD